MSNLTIPIRENIIPMYDDVLKDILAHKHRTYVFAGGRGSTKSSFIAIAIILTMLAYPNVDAVCFRKIANTIRDSVHAQIVWAINQLDLASLFVIPKTYNNPIVYTPTGQKIYFIGLDDPDKVKSIKPEYGYLGITWFEELDQYAGEKQLRKVTQSTRRGGQVFWDFRSFNPPISKNNWANEYADECEIDGRRSNTLVIRNTYLDVPPEWLGEDFIEDAEELKEINERAYVHEYLGVPTGTGGDVFQNVSDLDMEQQINITGVYGEVISSTKMYQTFDQIYNGIDWGFAMDPFRFVKMHFDKKHLDLYIFDEFSTVKTRNEDVFHMLYDERKLLRKDELVIADSAEPKSVADFRAYGGYVREAAKGPDSVRYGIKWLQGLRNIYIDKRRCPETWKEFTQYEYEQDRDGNFISAYPDENNHSIDAVRYAMEKYANRKGN